MPTRFPGRLLHLLLIGPRRVGPRLYDLYAHAIVSRAPLATEVFKRLAQTPAFQAHYLYLNVDRALALDPASDCLLIAGDGSFAFRPFADVAACAGVPSGFGYRLQITFADGSRWCARTLVSLEPLRTAKGLLAAALQRRAEGMSPPAADPAAIGRGLMPSG